MANKPLIDHLFAGVPGNFAAKATRYMEITKGMKNVWSIAGGPALEPVKKDKNGWWCKWHNGKEYRTDLFINEELTTEDPNQPEPKEPLNPKKKKDRD